jgi:AcrR family transcriptional regulator
MKERDSCTDANWNARSDGKKSAIGNTREDLLVCTASRYRNRGMGQARILPVDLTGPRIQPKSLRGQTMRSSRARRKAKAPLRSSAASKVTGRPRDARIDTEVISAVIAVLRKGGYDAVTIDGIARNVGRARSSLYRRWPSKRHLVAYAVVGELGEHPAADTGTLRGDLLSAVSTLWRAFRGPLGHALAGLVADMAQDAALASSIRREVMVPRRRSMREAIERACARGEARDDMNLELLLDMLTGPFYFRTLFRHASMSLKDTAQIVDYIVRLIRPHDQTKR